MKVKICPRCQSTRNHFPASAIAARALPFILICDNCGFRGFFPEVEVNSKKAMAELVASEKKVYHKKLTKEQKKDMIKRHNRAAVIVVGGAIVIAIILFFIFKWKFS